MVIQGSATLTDRTSILLHVLWLLAFIVVVCHHAFTLTRSVLVMFRPPTHKPGVPGAPAAFVVNSELTARARLTELDAYHSGRPALVTQSPLYDGTMAVPSERLLRVKRLSTSVAPADDSTSE